MTRRFRILVALCAVAAFGVTSAIAYATADSGSDVDQGALAHLSPAEAAATETVAVPVVQDAISSRFAIFRNQPATPMPPELVTTIASPTRFGRNAALARSIQTPYGTAWVIPGDGYLCLAVPDPVDGYGEGCMPTTVAAAQGLWVRLHGARDDGKALDTLVVPDGMNATVTTDQGPRALVPSANGVVSQLVKSSSPPALVPNP